MTVPERSVGTFNSGARSRFSALTCNESSGSNAVNASFPSALIRPFRPGLVRSKRRRLKASRAIPTSPFSSSNLRAPTLPAIVRFATNCSSPVPLALRTCRVKRSMSARGCARTMARSDVSEGCRKPAEMLPFIRPEGAAASRSMMVRRPPCQETVPLKEVISSGGCCKRR